MKPLQSVGMSAGTCSECEQLMRPITTCAIKQDSELNDNKLCELGIPPYDVVKVAAGEREIYLLLDGDQDFDHSAK